MIGQKDTDESVGGGLPTSSDRGADTRSKVPRDSIIGESPTVIGEVGPRSHNRDPKY